MRIYFLDRTIRHAGVQGVELNFVIAFISYEISGDIRYLVTPSLADDCYWTLKCLNWIFWYSPSLWLVVFMVTNEVTKHCVRVGFSFLSVFFFSPSFFCACYLADSGRVQLWSWPSLQELCSIRVHEEALTSVHVSPPSVNAPIEIVQ